MFCDHVLSSRRWRSILETAEGWRAALARRMVNVPAKKETKMLALKPLFSFKFDCSISGIYCSKSTYLKSIQMLYQIHKLKNIDMLIVS